MAKGFDLIIFDCDGVLVDSEPISLATLRETLAAHGLNVDAGYVRASYLGRSFATVQADFLKLAGREMPTTFEADYLARLFAAYRTGLRAMAGASELVGTIAGHYCAATSSSLERVTISLEVTGLLPLFRERIFCASMVARGKPAPDLFLHAAAAFGVAPVRCLVIEDSEVGIEAARNAGMTVWRFAGGSHFDPDAHFGGVRVNDVPTFRRMEEIALALKRH